MIKSKDHIGAVGFNAPEMLDEGTFTNKCDVWALGCLLYFILMRKPPVRVIHINIIIIIQ